MPSPNHTQASEHTPLLSIDDPTIPLTVNEITTTTTSKNKVQLRTQIGVILFVCVLYANLYLSISPEVSIRESIICDNYYNDLGRDNASITRNLGHERDCTVAPVQEELSLISQVYITLSQLAGFLLVFPYGVLADRIGRKKVLLLSVIGIVLCDALKLLVTWLPNHFPLRAIWLAPLFRLLGGGDAVAATVVLAGLADVYTAQDRTIVFARVASMATACELFSPLVASALMLKSPWIPLLLGFGMFLAGASAALVLVPETLISQDPLPEGNNGSESRSTPKLQSPFKIQNLGDQILGALTVFRESLVSLFAIKNVGFLLFGFFAATVGTIAAAFEIQYVHKRFGWSYSYASSILAIRPSITLVIFLIIVPLVSKISTQKFGLSNTQTDLYLLRVSAALLTTGTLLLSISNTSALAILSFVIFAFGNTFATIGKSLLTTLGPPQMAGTLLSAMNVSASLGAVIAGPIIAISFSWGLKQGGIWVGAPLFLVSLLYALTLASVSIMRLPNRSDKGDNNGEAHDEQD